MTGSIELDGDGSHLVIRFTYREDLVEQVKRLPGRRWDPKGKAWRVPSSHVDRVVSTFLQYGFFVDSGVCGLLAGTVQVETRATAAPAPPLATALSVSALNEQVRQALRGAFPQPLWVVGEVVDFDKTRGDAAATRKHLFFCLVEKRPGQEQPTATANVALFRDEAERLFEKLSQGEPPLRLHDGIEIRALVRVELYAAAGRYQLVIEDIDASFTLGKMALNRETILAELRAKGLAHRNVSLPLPTPALRVGVLSSLESDGWNDFLQELRGSRIGFCVTCHPMPVQGRELKQNMLAGLSWFARHSADFDVLCVIRGGGSRSDLAWFDDRDLALAVACHPLKIVCGIGHQRDQSVLDAIAHSEKTPTAVAAFLVRAVQQAAAELHRSVQRLAGVVQARLHQETRRLTRDAHELRRILHARLAGDGGSMRDSARRLGRAVATRVRENRTSLCSMLARLQLGVRLPLKAQRHQLDMQAARAHLLDPRRVLERGYTLVAGDDGRLLKSAAAVPPGALLDVRFHDGRVAARATGSTAVHDGPP